MKILFNYQTKETENDIGGRIFANCSCCGHEKEVEDNGYAGNTIQDIRCLFCGYYSSRSIIYKSDSYRKCTFTTSILKYLSTDSIVSGSKMELNTNDYNIVCEKSDRADYTVLLDNVKQKEITECYIDDRNKLVTIFFDETFQVSLSFHQAHKLFQFLNIYAFDDYNLFDAYNLKYEDINDQKLDYETIKATSSNKIL